ncbi:MAG: Arc family DNA-binding protein [Candidatus Marinimicrobia bacterium]|nr:Arc family DNA-binding protein [Candidatus Neomarinimicrobiota bacterium]MCF7827776.1 Arc family DNA-binding protein [Candidatus Neomarinimicrobiota bacterium]MCF7879469.1 Arc family DNA-binding protein [Candidatus Neomarinimicrobiota bacterium]
MKNITVKNIPDDLYEKIRDHAKSHRRSVNKEIIHCLSQAVEARPFDPEEHLESAQKFRQRTESHTLTPKEIADAKAHGRP